MWVNNPYQMQPQMLPPQQVIRVRGKDAVNALRLSPNSSVLLMDETAPIVWLCVSDGLGNVSSTPYDITPHVGAPPVDMSALDARITSIETMIREICCKTQMGIQEAKSEVLGAMAQNKIEALQAQVNQLQLQQATAGMLKFPSTWSYGAGPFPPIFGGANI